MAPPTIHGVPLDKATTAKLRKAGGNAAKWTAERDRLIAAAVKDGGSLREIAAAVGLSHTAIRKIADRLGGQ